MPLLPRFDTPAFLTDVPASSPFYSRFSARISRLIGGTSSGDGSGAFYDPTLTNMRITGEKVLTWMGFPRQLLQNAINRIDAYWQGDADVPRRVPQIEYFEWKVERDTAGKITKVTFVTEAPEYYEVLWETDRAAVVNLYRTLVNPAVTEADLHTGGRYNKFNRWNTTDGIVHYIHPANSFFDAIGLSKQSVRSVPPIRDNYEAKPSLYNRPTSADPRISFDVHMLVRKGFHVTVRNPVGLYMAGWDNSGITHPDGRPAANYWRIVRGVPGMVLRLEYEVPAARGFVAGDLKIGGRPLEFGGQLAELITVVFPVSIGVPAKK